MCNFSLLAQCTCDVPTSWAVTTHSKILRQGGSFFFILLRLGLEEVIQYNLLLNTASIHSV